MCWWMRRLAGFADAKNGTLRRMVLCWWCGELHRSKDRAGSQCRWLECDGIRLTGVIPEPVVSSRSGSVWFYPAFPDLSRRESSRDSDGIDGNA